MRSVDCADALLLTSGLDRHTYLYSLENDRYNIVQAYQLHQDAVYINRFSRDPSFFFTAGGDSKVFRTDLEGNNQGQFLGHEATVSSLDFTSDVLITGSWDATAKLWDIKTQQCIATLPKTHHAYAVTVLARDSDFITGSQSGKINFWSQRGDHIRSIQAHQDIIREIKVVPGVGFATCSNDQTVKVWTDDGRLIQTLEGHSGYVFCIAVGPGPLIYSGSDDRTVKVWSNGVCIDTIQQPNSVWSLCVNSLSDLVIGCGDSEVRVFTKSHLRLAPPADQDAFQKLCEASSVAQSQESVDVAKLPLIQDMHKHRGKKDGAYQLFNEGGATMAYCWHSEGEFWEKIGEVTGAAPVQSVKTYSGDEVFPQGEYDFIFDVDLGEGRVSKLPYSNHQNPLEAAEKFCIRESLGRTYLFQIEAFINKNAKPSWNAAPTVTKSEVQAKYFPYYSYLSFDAVNMEQITKKIVEVNGTLQAPLALDPAEVEQLGKLSTVLNQKSNYRSSSITRKDFLVINKLLQWPGTHLFPVFDLLRVVQLHPNCVELYKGSEQGANIISPAIAMLARGSGPGLVTAARLLCNMFGDNTSLFAVQKRRQAVLEAALGHIDADNKPLRLSLATLLLNYSVLFISKDDPEGRIQILSAIVEFLQVEKDEETMFRGFVTVGNLVSGGGIQSDLVTLATNVGLRDLLTAKQSSATGKAMEVVRELQGAFFSR